VPEFKGLFVKDADKQIISLLKGRQRLANIGVINHSYPFCWRSETPLIYKAVRSTFINVESVKDQLVANNKQTYWVPSEVRENRFHNWLLNARDWAVSRNRFWGTPIPMWVSDDGEEVVVVTSIQDLEEKTGVKPITDLHRDSIDHLTIPSKKGKGLLRRVDEVFDCWFESGSMPYAQCHYPFENKEAFEASFPADFIAEGIDQTRGWFYTLMVLSTCLFDKPAFKNLICNGLVLAEDGRKMSKRLKNYPDPVYILNAYGADSLRLYLINSPVVHAEDLKFKEDGVKQVLKDVFLPWYHAYRLFIQSANAVETAGGAPFQRDAKRALGSKNTMDRWILASCNSLVGFMRKEMEAYRLYTVVPKLVRLIERLTNWYVRMNKDRFSGDEKLTSLSVLYEVLLMLCKTMAPLTPFFVELQYQNLRLALPAAERFASVHFDMIPQVAAEAVNDQIEADISRMQEMIVAGRAIRDRHLLSMRTPLPEVTLVHQDQAALDAVHLTEAYIKDELNVRTVKTALVSEVPHLVKFKCQPNFKALGARFGKEFKKVQDEIKGASHAQLSEFLSKGSLTVGGNTFGKDDIVVQLEYSGGGSQEPMETEDKRGIVLLDTKPDGAMLDEATAREVCAKIQKLRKEANLRKTDEVEVGFHVEAESGQKGKGSEAMLARVLAEKCEYVKGKIGRPLLPAVSLPKLAVPLIVKKEEVRVQRLVDGAIKSVTEQLTLTLCRGCPFLDGEELAKALPDESVRNGVQMALHSKDMGTLKAELAASGGKLGLTLDGEKVALTLGQHFFLSGADAVCAGAISIS